MIAVDTSALMAMVLKEPEAQSCWRALAYEPHRVMSAVTLAEALIVARRRGFGDEMSEALRLIGAEIIPATLVVAYRASEAYDAWGKGVHPARLNLVDCFSYDAAQANGCPLLYVGRDFAQTDVAAAVRDAGPRDTP